MADVAKAAGCSQATVSLVLNDVTEVKLSQDTRARVLEAARQLRYGEHSPVSRPILDRADRPVIGFIADQLTTMPETTNAIEGARRSSWDRNVTLLVAQTMDRIEREESAVRAMLSAGVQGIILMSVFTRRIELTPLFRTLPVPLVLLNCYTGANDFASVVPDELEGGRRATQELVRFGHKSIATITGEMYMEAAEARLAGYRAALKSARIELRSDYIVTGDWTPSSGYDATQKLMSLTSPPTAIFCQNDKMALGCLNALLDLGLKVPEDVSIIGYDDDELSRHLRPQLTTIDLPHRAMGAWAIEYLLDSTGKFPTARTELECALVIRSSAGAPKP
jgi:LacI family transcriptional regulator